MAATCTQGNCVSTDEDLQEVIFTPTTLQVLTLDACFEAGRELFLAERASV